MTATEYNDTFKWVISKQTLGHILSSTQREQFVSSTFIIGGITFQLIGYPMYDTGTYHLYLRPMNIPPTWDKIVVAATLYCTETICGDASIFTYNKQQLFRAHHWSPGCLSLNEIKNRNLYQLTLSVNVQILQIRCTNKVSIYENISNIGDITTLFQKQTFKWELDSISLREMKHSLYGKCFISFVNALFCLKIFPNGYQKEGQVHIEIQWFGIPGVINNQLLDWKIVIPQANIVSQGTNRFSYDVSSIHWGSNVFSLKQFKTHNALTIYCDIRHSSLNTPPVVDYNQYVSNTMNKMYAEIEGIKAIVNRNYENNQKCLAQISKQIMLLSQHQMDTDKNIEEMWSEMHNKNGKNAIGKKEDLFREWLHNEVKLPQYLQLFVENGYDDMDVMRDVNENDLKIIGIGKIGHRKKIIKSFSNRNNKLDARKQEKINKILKIEKICDSDENKQEIGQEERIRNWLNDGVKLPQYFESLVKNGYDDLELICDITFDELQQIGVDKMGHRKKIIKYAKQLLHSLQFKTASTASPQSQLSLSAQSQSYSHHVWSDESVYSSLKSNKKTDKL